MKPEDEAMKKTFLTFLLVGANFMLVADESQTKYSPPKPDTTGIMVWHDDQTTHEYDHTLGKQWWYDQYIDGWPIDVEQSGEHWETKDMSQHWDYGYGGTANSTWTIDHTVITEEWDYTNSCPIWVTTSDPQTKYVGGRLYSTNGGYPYASSTWTGDTNGIGLDKPLGCEVCEVQNNYDTDIFDDYTWEESQAQHTYTRQAHTVLALLSGGRAIPGRKILHEISGWAKHMPGPYNNGQQPPYYDVYYYQYTGFHSLPCVSNSLVHLLGNTLHDDPNYPAYPDQPVKGTLYYVTAAGADPIKFTPTVFGDHFSIYGVNDTTPGANDSPSFRDAPCPLIVSLAPDRGLLVTTNPVDTYLVAYCAGSYVTVSANPPCNIDNVMPTEWQMTGGSPYPNDNTKRLVDRGQVGSTTITATAAGSSKSITIIVYQAITAVFADSGDCWTTQHAWWLLQVQPTEVYPYLKTSTGINVSSQLGLGGYYGQEDDISCVCPGCQSSVVMGSQPIRGSDPPAWYSATGSYWWCVPFENLIVALDYVRLLRADSGTYFINCGGSTYDCVTEAVSVSRTAGANFNYGGWSGCAFSDFLNQLSFGDPPFCDCY